MAAKLAQRQLEPRFAPPARRIIHGAIRSKHASPPLHALPARNFFDGAWCDSLAVESILRQKGVRAALTAVGANELMTKTHEIRKAANVCLSSHPLLSCPCLLSSLPPRVAPSPRVKSLPPPPASSGHRWPGTCKSRLP